MIKAIGHWPIIIIHNIDTIIIVITHGHTYWQPLHIDICYWCQLILFSHISYWFSFHGCHWYADGLLIDTIHTHWPQYIAAYFRHWYFRLLIRSLLPPFFSLMAFSLILIFFHYYCHWYAFFAIRLIHYVYQPSLSPLITLSRHYTLVVIGFSPFITATAIITMAGQSLIRWHTTGHWLFHIIVLRILLFRYAILHTLHMIIFHYAIITLCWYCHNKADGQLIAIDIDCHYTLLILAAAFRHNTLPPILIILLIRFLSQPADDAGYADIGHCRHFDWLITDWARYADAAGLLIRCYWYDDAD